MLEPLCAVLHCPDKMLLGRQNVEMLPCCIIIPGKKETMRRRCAYCIYLPPSFRYYSIVSTYMQVCAVA
jgi:hypothetical protein